ncbi:MAG: AraC family transcriptional regulator [Synoicihabitans sp.]
MAVNLNQRVGSAQRELIPAFENQLIAFKADTDMWTPWHYHPEIDILLVLKNTGHHITGDFIGDIRPGTLLVNGSNVPHAFHPHEPAEGDPANPAMLVLQFSPETWMQGGFARLEMERIRHFIASTDRSYEVKGETRAHVDRLMHEMVAQNDAQRVAQFILILDTFANAPPEDLQPLVSEIYAPSLKQENVSRIDRVKSWIVENLESDFDLSDAAQRVAMSPKSFSRFFRKNTGKSFIQFVIELRIGLACRLLVQSDASVAEVCYASGFRNLSNFNRLFRERKALSPREFRAQFRR